MPTGFEKFKSKLDQERGVGFSPELEKKPRPANEARASLHQAEIQSEPSKEVSPFPEPVQKESPVIKAKSNKVSKTYSFDEKSLLLLKDLRYATNKSYSDLLIEGIQLLKAKYLK